MILGDDMAFLCISLNNSSVNTIHLLDGDLCDIDRYTANFETAKDILKEYPEKIEEFNNIYEIKSDGDTDIKIRLFLPNDKERFVMYKKHLVAFNVIIKNRNFMMYALNYDKNLIDKKYRNFVSSKTATDKEVYDLLKKIIGNLSTNDYYDFVRRICHQYGNYAEDYRDQKLPSVDTIYHHYMDKLKSEVQPVKKVRAQRREVQTKHDPFAVFEHPNFFKKFGSTIDCKKPVFILGGQPNDRNRDMYTEIYNNCKKCFQNPIYYPLNANVFLPLTPEFVSIYDQSIFIIVIGSEFNHDLETKINRAIEKGITTLILTNNESLNQIYKAHFSDIDTIVICNYETGSYDSQKQFADIVTGFYLNAYKVGNR